MLVVFVVSLRIIFVIFLLSGAASTICWIANYTPRRVSLDGEDDTNSEVSRPAVKSWYGIWRRTIRLEVRFPAILISIASLT